MDPQDPIEPKDELVQVCNDCDKASEYVPECSCEDSTGYHEEWWLKCAYCNGVYPDDEAYSKHNCN